MSIDVLIHARDEKAGIWEAGDINSWTATGDWSGVNRLPIYLTLRVTGADAADGIKYTEVWTQKVDYSIQNENELGYRIRLEVDGSWVSASGENKDFLIGRGKQLRDFVIFKYSGAVANYGSDYALIDVPKPLRETMVARDLGYKKGVANVYEGDDIYWLEGAQEEYELGTAEKFQVVGHKDTTLPEAKAEMNEIFENMFRPRHYYFAPAELTWALNNAVDGFLTMTKAQVVANISTRLDD